MFLKQNGEEHTIIISPMQTDKKMFLKQIGEPQTIIIFPIATDKERARGSMVERSTQIPKVAGSNPRCATLGIGYDWLMTAYKPEMAIPVSLVFVGSIPSYATCRYATACEGSSLSSRAQRNKMFLKQISPARALV
ncbi:unnamed protein product [Schistocephalus solidus]|uniref:TPP_enzyme_N domain-containing protein n=1 Tax=Schistocephalus solidus TaxID=70667 RepID=A0A183SAT4_SCHSO|nr:unnamed protein product [Schistocephalus solidus]